MKPYFSEAGIEIYLGDCRSILGELPAESVNCCVTSPPYWGLRDYGTAQWQGGTAECDHISRPQVSDKAASNRGSLRDNPYKDICGKCGAMRIDSQIGLEKTPEEYVAEMVAVFREVKRVLRSDGTLWLNLGDSYAGSGLGWSINANSKQMSHKYWIEANGKTGKPPGYISAKQENGIKPKDLCGIPWMVAFALRADGWYLRQDIIWAKPNPMPESVTDRCTKSHEYVFLLSKSERYYYNQEAIKTPLRDASIARLIQDVESQDGSDRVPGKTNGKMKAVKFGGNKQCPDTRLQSGKEWNPKMAGGGNGVSGHSGYFDEDGNPLCGIAANKKSVWFVTTQGFAEAHFATFPPKLIEPCILAGSPAGGTVLDPFFGAGTTGLVANKLNCKCIGIELNAEYCEISAKRLSQSVFNFPAETQMAGREESLSCELFTEKEGLKGEQLK